MSFLSSMGGPPPPGVAPPQQPPPPAAPEPRTGASRWFFTPDELGSTPSMRAGITKEKEASYRQQAANFIQDMGQRLQV